MSKKVIMIILDGFSSNYINENNAPNLAYLEKTGCLTKMTSMFGFQGIGAAMYSGASSEVTKVFTEFVRDDNLFFSSKVLQKLLNISDLIPDDNLSSLSRSAIYKLIKPPNAGISNLIPPNLLKYFSPKVHKNFTSANSLGEIKTVFDVLRETGLSYKLQKPSPNQEIRQFNQAMNDIQKRSLPDLLVIHPCSLDMLGHNFGPCSVQIKKAVFQQDIQIGRLIKGISSSEDDIMLLILSDHGMVPINRCLNLKYYLSQLPLTMGKDYLVFIDSTIARFWFFNAKAKQLIENKLNDIQFGRLLNKEDKQFLGIERIGFEYGELMFAINENVVFFPDYFRKHSPPKGMHGYAYQHYDTPIFGLKNNHLKRKIKAPKFIDVCPTILDFLKLPIPQTCEGESLLR